MGVKSLWELLAPVGRPVMLETMEGKAVAIDSSIWIYQFQATMRAKDGQVLSNAHVLGFLRRICKLMFYGMKPVFVFDGGAPDLKKKTLMQRKEKKSGAAESHAKLAQKLLAAQMRREALKHVKAGKTKAYEEPVVLDENTVYLEDIDASIPKSTAKKPASTASPSKKGKFYDHDPYRLPDVDVGQRIAQATRATAPDPRLATEDELRAFIEDMRPEDFDVTSAAFQELPTEVQYEIIGDLRLKSRQTSYSRLQQMLKAAPTPLDFSKQQIKNLQQRNSLTQQLLATTDSIGKAHISIPVRIASERNKEYVLIKNDGEGGGWILGIRDDGTKEKPIVIDHEVEEQERAATLEDDEDDDEEMEEVAIPVTATYDPDLRNLQRDDALGAIEQRSNLVKKTSSRPLFIQESDDDDHDSEDERIAIAVQRSLDDRPKSPSPSFAMYGVDGHNDFDDNRFASTSKVTGSMDYTPSKSYTSQRAASPDRYPSTPLGTALAFANTTPSRQHISTPARSFSSMNAGSFMFGAPTLLAASAATPSKSPAHELSPVAPPMFLTHHSDATSQESVTHEATPPRTMNVDVIKPDHAAPLTRAQSSTHVLRGQVPLQDSRGQHEDVNAVASFHSPSRENILSPKVRSLSPPGVQDGTIAGPGSPEPVSLPPPDVDILPISNTPPPIPKTPTSRSVSPEAFVPYKQPVSEPLFIDDLDVEEPASTSILPNPFIVSDAPVRLSSVSPTRPASPGPAADMEEAEDWDAAQEMDPVAEEGEFAQFISDVKGRDINEVRREIDDEIVSLNQLRRAAMRDSEDITQQMIHQIMTMLRLFGIPYITAPLEAEAQCAELVMLGLVDGIITDDSDVFLFGGERVFKNMFNQSKTVECFLTTDLTRELGLDRGTLVRLAYLLGSDYVDGLSGVGPVVAMELLKEFPGDDGLHKFRDWWSKVQMGKDRDDDNKSTFRKRFKKKFKNLYLSTDWPNPLVRDAYYHPTVDESDEPFKWGLPDLDGLRVFLHEELGWGQSKVDDLLVPIIQKAGKRAQGETANRQGNLNNFFDVSAGSGTVAPRRRQAYASKRLQQVVSEYRKKRKAALDEPEDSMDEASEDEGSGSLKPAKKKVKSVVQKEAKETSETRGRGRGRGRTVRGRGRGRGRKQSSRQKESSSSEDVPSEGDDFAEKPDVVDAPLAVQLRPRPKPKPTYKRTGSKPT